MNDISPEVKERLARFTELTRQMKGDPEVLGIVRNFCARNDVPDNNVGLLAQDFAEEFDLMCMCIDDLLAQAPTEERSPWD